MDGAFQADECREPERGEKLDEMSAALRSAAEQRAASQICIFVKASLPARYRRGPQDAMLRPPGFQRVDLMTWVRWNCQRSTMRNPTRLGVTYAGARLSTRPGGNEFPLW